MRFCANISLLYRELDFIDRFAAAAEDGFQAVEIQFPYELPASRVKQQLDEHNLNCVLINVPAGDLMSGGLGLACRPEKQNEYKLALHQCLEYVELIRPAYVNVLAGRYENEAEKSACLNMFLENLALTEKALSPYSVITTYEAINQYDMPQFLLSSFADMASIADQLSCSNIKMQFDIYHMTRMNEPVLQRLENHLDEIGHIQFADDSGRGEPGTGSVPFNEIFDLLRGLNYMGWLGAEYVPTKANTSDTLAWFKSK